MNTNLRWKPMLAAGAAAVVFTVGAATMLPQVSFAQANPPAQSEQQSQQKQPAQPKQQGMATAIDREALLAAALGITAEELQAAQTEALNAALDQAVEQDLLTQTQADALRERIDAGAGAHFGFGGRGFGDFGRFGGEESGIDIEALLAKALGITTDELAAAQVEARDAAVDQAVVDGALTQEEADLMQAQQAFRDYLVAQQPSYEEQVNAAVAAKAITQEQADLLLANQQAGGPWGRGMMPGMGEGMRGHGMGGDRPMDQGWDENGGGQPGGMDGGRGHGGGRGLPPAGSDQSQDDSGQTQPTPSF